MSSKIRVAVIGCGYWGPNLVRNFSLLNEFELVGVVDLKPERLEYIQSHFRVPKVTTRDKEVLEDPEIEAVAIATPISTHAELARKALEAGKHVLLEKPMAHSVAECDQLNALAEARGRVLLVDHTYLYTGAVETIHQIVAGGDLGDLYYFDSVRINLGLFQHDYNVVWDLAPHDLSILLHLLEERPLEVQAVGAAPVDSGERRLESIAYLSLRFPSGMIGHVHVNWLAPVKIRLTLLGGSRRMVVWDDLEPDTKVKLYDRGVDTHTDAESVYRTLVQYRTGDMFAPRLDKTEALKKECIHFFRCIREGETPRSGGPLGRDVVAVLEAAQSSLEEGGRPVTVPQAGG